MLLYRLVPCTDTCADDTCADDTCADDTCADTGTYDTGTYAPTNDNTGANIQLYGRRL